MEKLLQTYLPSEHQVDGALKRSVHELPSLPVVALKLLKITGEESANATALARIVETDLVIAARVLRRVNSAHYGLRQSITSLSHAVVILGFSAIRAIALEVSLFDLMSRRDVKKKFDRILFWQHSLTVASLSKVMARLLGHPDPEEVYAAGLLHDIGKLILDVHGRVSYREFLENFRRSGEGPLVAEEKMLMGLSHDAVGGYFCTQWRLPDVIAGAILLHHQPFVHLPMEEEEKLLIAIVSLADFITWTQGLGSVQVPAQPVLQRDVDAIIPVNGLNFRTLLETIGKEVTSVGMFYNFNFPTPEVFHLNLLQTNIRLSRLNRRQYERQVIFHEKLQILGRIQARLSSSPQGMEHDEIIRETLAAIQEDFQFDSIYLLKIDPRQRSLIINACWPMECNQDKLGCSFPISPDSKGILTCLRERKVVIMNMTRPRDRVLLRKIGAEEVAMVPLAAHGRILGLLAVDNRITGQPFARADLSLLAIVTNELGLALEHARTIADLKVRAELDGLTGIYNRGTVETLMQQAFRESVVENLPLAAGILDVDFFKKFNDTYGHQAGDNILRLLATTMKRLSRPTDLVGRLGGEEFVFLLYDTGEEEAYRFAERMRKEIEGLGMMMQNRFPRCRLTVSIGIAPLTHDAEGMKELLSWADDALYQAKNTGRNKVVAFRQNSFLECSSFG